MVIIFRDCKYVIVHYSNFTLLQFWNVNPNRLTYSYFRKGYQLVIECSTERDYEKKQLREIMKNSIFLFFSNIETIFSEMPVFSSDQIKCLTDTRKKTTEGYAMLLCHNNKNITAHFANRLPLKNVFRLTMDEILILHDLIPWNWPLKLCLYLR